MVGRVEGDRASLWEVEDVARRSMDLLSCLVGYLNFALDDDLHLMIRICIHEGRSLLQTIETTGDCLVGVILITDEWHISTKYRRDIAYYLQQRNTLPGPDVTEEVVIVRDQWRLVGRGRL